MPPAEPTEPEAAEAGAEAEVLCAPPDRAQTSPSTRHLMRSRLASAQDCARGSRTRLDLKTAKGTPQSPPGLKSVLSFGAGEVEAAAFAPRDLKES